MPEYFILALILGLCSCSQEPDPPNILLIVVDNLGYSDLPCYGNKLVETPNIDMLVSEGIRFTQSRQLVASKLTRKKRCELGIE